jgi:hypothetical protein
VRLGRAFPIAVDERDMSRPNLMTNLQALIEEERELTASARDRLGSFVELGQSALALLNTFIASIGPDHVLAAALQLATQKAATLAFLSYIRHHLAQAEFNSRQVIEFCSLCAFLLAHPEEDVAKGTAEQPGCLKPPKPLSGKAYKWMEKEHPHHSELLLGMKNQINDTASHASVCLTHFTFDWEAGDGDEYRGSFFDNIEPDVSRLYLVSFARLILIVVETIRLTAERYGGFTLREGIVQELTDLERNIEAHRVALGKRFGRTDVDAIKS